MAVQNGFSKLGVCVCVSVCVCLFVVYVLGLWMQVFVSHLPPEFVREPRVRSLPAAMS